MRHSLFIPRPRVRARRLHGLGYPILPDNFTTAAGVSESFSPQTPDSIVMQILTQQNQALPADLAAAWAAAAQSNVPTVTATPPAPIPSNVPPQFLGPPVAITPGGTPISTQTGAGLRLTNITAVNGVTGVYVCTLSDGSSHYCDVDGNAISYTPPASTPATTPAAGSFNWTNPPIITPMYVPPAVTPSGQPISTTSGTPTAPAAAAAPAFDLSSITSWLSGSMFLGIPNWMVLAGGAGALFLLGDSGSSPRRR
jgi:hypothetical protein